MQRDMPHVQPAILAVTLGELRQMFNSMDASPFRERDLDTAAEAYIVDWAREQPRNASLALRVYVGGTLDLPDDENLLREAVDQHFLRCAASERGRLRRLLRNGGISLLVGLAFVGATLGANELIGNLLRGIHSTRIVQESLVIGAWVALWRPMEIFLYDWWPIRAEARLYERLGRIDVRCLPAEPTKTAGGGALGAGNTSIVST